MVRYKVLGWVMTVSFADETLLIPAASDAVNSLIRLCCLNQFDGDSSGVVRGFKPFSSPNV